MRQVFVDSSGFYALLDGTDPNCPKATACFTRADAEQWELFTTSYVFQETAALVQHRLGWEALDAWLEVAIPFCEIIWVHEALHQKALARWRGARSRRLSLCDCVSLDVMAQRDVTEAIAFDEHFSAAGIRLPA